MTDRPAIYYRLSDPTSAQAVDASGHNVAGTYSSEAAHTASGAIAGDTDGAVTMTAHADQAALDASADSLPTGAASRTMETWFRSSHDGVTPYGTPLIAYGAGHGFQLRLQDNITLRVTNDAGDDLFFTLPYNIVNGEWHLLDLTYAGTTATVYYDGQDIGSGTMTLNTVTTGSTFDLGYFNGDYDEAAVYPTALTPARIQTRWTRGQSSTILCAATPTGPYATAVLADHPVAYYRLSDPGRLQYDSSGNCHNAVRSPETAPSASGAIAGDTDGAVTMTAHADQAALDASADSLPTGAASRTMETWFRSSHDGVTPYGTPLIAYGAGHGFQLRLQDNITLRVTNDAGDDLFFTLPYNIVNGEWHLLDLTYAGTTATVYYDGQDIGSGTMTLNTVTTGSTFDLGYFNGDYDEAAVYPTALTPARIQTRWTRGQSSTILCAATPTGPYATAVLADHPVAYYRLSDPGRLQYDSSGNCHNAVRSPETAPSASGAIAGDTDGAVTMTAHADQAALDASADSLPTGAASRTMETWFRSSHDGVTPYGTPLIAYGAGHGFQLRLQDNITLRVTNDAGDDLFFTLPYNIVNGEWHLLDLTYAGTTATVYYDGQDIGSGTMTLNTVTTGSTFDLGYFNGDYDEAAVYPTALTPARIQTRWTRGQSSTILCAATPTGPYATAVLADHPVAYYRLSDPGRLQYDSSGNCHNAVRSPETAPSASGAIAGDTDGAVTMTAHADQAALDASADSLPTGAASRTMETWFRSSHDGVTPYGTPLIAYGAGHGFQLRLQDNITLRVTNDAGDDLFFTLPYNIVNGEWHLLDLTYAGTTATVYYDGQDIGSSTMTLNTVTTGSTFDLGYFNGDYDEAAVYPTALTPARIQTRWTRGQSSTILCAATPTGPYATAVLADHPVAYYRLSDPGRLQYDSSGNCHNAVRSPETAPSASGAIAGDTDGAVTMTAHADQAALDASADSLPTGAASRTMETWFRSSHDGVTPYGTPLIAYGAGHGFQLRLQDNITLRVTNDAGDDLFFTLPYNIVNGEWHLLDLTYAGTTATVYYDGQDIGSGTMTLNTVTTGSTFDLGYFNGDYDEAAVYPTALTPARIQTHWRASGHAPPIGGPVSSLEAGAGGNPMLSCPLSPMHGCAGDPVDTAFGTMFETMPGILIPGRGPGLSWTTSHSSAAAATDGPLGFGWSPSYGAHLQLAANGDVTVVQENGAQTVFTLTGTGFTAPPRVQGTLTARSDGSFVLVRNKTEVLTFGPSGLLVSVADLNGETTRLAYSGGRLRTVTDPAGRSLGFTWTGTHISRVTDPAGRHVDYTYDTAGNLAAITALDGGVTTFQYDSAHRIVAMYDPVQTAAGSAGRAVTTTWDDQGRVASQTDQLNRTTTFTYTGDNSSAAGGTTLVTDPAGHRTLDVYAYNERSSTTVGYGTADATTTVFAYDPDTLMVTSVETRAPGDPNTHGHFFTYNQAGRPTTETDGLDRQQTTTYNNLNEPLTVTAPNPGSAGPATITTTYKYDGAGNLLSQSTPVYQGTGKATAQKTTYQHTDPAHPGDVTSTTDPLKHTTSYAHDPAGDLTAIVSPQGRKQTFTYDTVGRTLTTVSPNGYQPGNAPADFTTTYTYDDAGRLLSSTTANGTQPVTLGHTYTADGLTKTDTDAIGRTTTYLYDDADQLITTRRNDGSTVSTGYNPDGTISTQKNAAGATTSYARDALGRVTSETDPLHHTTRYTLDGTGLPLTVTNPSGQITTNTYDNADELTQTSYSTNTPKVTRTYGPAADLVRMVDGTGTTTWAYDSLGRPTASTSPEGTVSSVHDLLGNTTGLTYANGQTVQRAFNEENDLVKVTDWLGHATTFQYDANEQVTSTKTPNGVTASTVYDAAGRSTSQAFIRGSTTLASLAYQRDPVGQLTAETPIGLGSARSYSYNPLGELTNDTGSPFTYNAADDLTTLRGGKLQYNAAGQVTKSTGGGPTNYKYDQQGNRVSSTGTNPATLKYDQNNQLTSWVSGTTHTTYTYDGNGLRATKATTGTGASGSAFTYDTDTDSYPLILSDGSATYIYGPSDVPIEQIDGAGEINYLHTDQLGSVRLLTSSTGATTGTKTYDAYGRTTETSTKTSFGYAGQYTDTDSGLIWMRYRYYDPLTGQFITRDPAQPITRTAYTYAGGDPVNNIDPTGLNLASDLKSYAQDKTKQAGEYAGETTAKLAKASTYLGWATDVKNCDGHLTTDCAVSLVTDFGSKGLLAEAAPELSLTLQTDLKPVYWSVRQLNTAAAALNGGTSSSGGPLRNYFGHYACDQYGHQYYVREGYAQGGAWHPGW